MATGPRDVWLRRFHGGAAPAPELGASLAYEVAVRPAARGDGGRPGR
jgi:hypothetical protein